MLFRSGAILAAYSILLITGNGFDFSDENVISVVDHKVLGPDHMYSSTVNGVRLHFDPEGLLSTLPSVAHMLIGFICGGMILALKDNRQRVLHLFIVGTIMTFAGFLIDYGIPVNKKVWSPTFVLTTFITEILERSLERESGSLEYGPYLHEYHVVAVLAERHNGSGMYRQILVGHYLGSVDDIDVAETFASRTCALRRIEGEIVGCRIVV